MGSSSSKYFDTEPEFEFRPGDLAFLIMGCAGTKTGEFADMAMGKGASPLQKPKIRLLRETNIPGFRQPVVFIVLPGSEKRQAKDSQNIGRVQQWLRKSRPTDPYVDHILLFPEDPLGIQPARFTNYLEDFASLCRGTSTRDVFSKLSLILNGEPGATIQDRDRWEFFVERGVSEHYFGRANGSPREILQRVATDGAL